MQDELIAADYKLAPTGPLDPSTKVSLPESIAFVRLKSLQHFDQLIKKCLDHIDDELFNLAQRSIFSEEQSLYFKIMEKSEAKMESIRRRFLSHLQLSFDYLPVNVENNAAKNTISHHQQLVSYALHVDQYPGLKRALGVCHNELAALSLRFSDVMHKRVDVATSPLFPSALFEHYLSSVNCVVNDKKLLEIMAKLFDKHVLARLEPFYRMLNKALAMRGVLPELQSNAVEKALHENPNNDNDCDRFDQNDRFDVRQSSPKKSLSQWLMDLQCDEVFSQSNNTVTFYQRLLDAGYVEQDGFCVEASGCEQIRALILVSESLDETIEQHYDNAALVEILSQLRVSILKVVALDSDFLYDPTHSSRQLIEAIVRQSWRWYGDQSYHQDACFKQVIQTVQACAESMGEDVTELDHLSTDLQCLFAQEDRRQATLAKRVLSAEQGKQKLLMAKKVVIDIIKQCRSDSTITPIFRRLIEKYWAQYLLVTLLKKGVASPEWRDAVATLRDIISSCHIVDFYGDEHRWKKLAVRIRQCLEQSLSTINANPLDVGFMLKKVDAEYGQLSHMLAQRQFDQCKPSAPLDIDLSLAAFSNNEAGATTLTDLESHYQFKIGRKMLYQTAGGDYECLMYAGYVAESESVIFYDSKGVFCRTAHINRILHELSSGVLSVLQPECLFNATLAEKMNVTQTEKIVDALGAGASCH